MSRVRQQRGPSEAKQRPQLVRALGQVKKRLGGHVRLLRQARGLTQESAAERVGLSTIQFGRVERGEANVSLATLVALAAAFRVEVRDLLD